MTRYARIALVVFALLLLVATSVAANPGGVADQHRSPVAASHQPSASPSEDGKDAGETDEANEPETDGTAPTQALLDRLVAQLDAAGITATAEELTPLIEKYGVGGAVRLLSWASASGKDVAEIAAMRDEGLGWGQIAAQLNEADSSLHLTPGIGSIMSAGHGHAGAAHANGHANAHANAKAGNGKP
jgi:hypothetical protein